MERRSKGVCYFYDEPYSEEHNMVHKKLQVHVIEVDEEEEKLEDYKVEFCGDKTCADPQISVNALTKISRFKTMRTMQITGYHKKRPLHIL